MRVLLINPPFLPRFCRSHRTPAVVKSGNLFYPYWLALAAAVLDSHEHTIKLIDCPAAGIKLAGLLGLAAQFNPELVVMDSSAPSWYADCETAGALKQLLQHCKFCLTGNHVTMLWRETLEHAPAVDFVTLGEYEETVADLADALALERAAESVPGLACRSHLKSGRPLERPLIEDLDRLPMVSPIYQRFLDPNNYSFNLSWHPFIQIMAGRGCSSSCFFCAYPQTSQGHPYRHRTAENIVKEMLWVQQNMTEIRQINFEDENFGEDRAFARRLGEVAQVRGVHLPFFANISARLDSNSLVSLHAAGLQHCSVGFDSPRSSLLASMGKEQSEQMITGFMTITRSLGILVHGCFLVGFPGETRQSMEELLHWACRIKPDSAQFYPVMPYPGTGAWRYYHHHRYLATHSFRDWITRAGWPRCVLNLPGLLPHQIDHFCDSAFIRFHLRPGYLAYKLWQAITRPEEGYRSLRACWQFGRYFRRVRRSKPQPLPARSLIVPDTWRVNPPIPSGRMQVIERRSLRSRPADTAEPDQQG